MTIPLTRRSLCLVGRTFDSKSPCKQFGVDAFHASNCGRAVKKPGGGVQTFFVKALPFGATGSVAAFLRVAASVPFIGLRALDIWWTNFFDYTVVCQVRESENVEFYVTSLFRLLGIDYTLRMETRLRPLFEFSTLRG